MLIDEYIKKLETAEQSILQEFVPIAEEAALNTKALVVKQIQEEGVGKYSTKGVPAYLYLDENGEPKLERTKSNAGINFIKKRAKEDKKKMLTWADLRDAEGLQTNFVDLTFTGEMFRDLHIIGTNIQQGRITTILGASRKETQDKLKWSVARYGNILQPNQEEKARIVAIIKKQITKKLKQLIEP